MSNEKIVPMKSYLIHTLAFLIILNLAVSLPAQVDSTLMEEAEVEHLILTGKNNGQQVILRWAPESAAGWHLGNYYGYGVEKLCFKDTSELRVAQYESLTPGGLKPWPLEKWASIASGENEDKYAAIAAQAIYGERNKSALDNTEASFIEKAREFQNLYAIAMLSAEYSAQAARASALRWEDEAPAPGTSCFYRVYCLARDPDLPMDTAYWVINGDVIDEMIPVEISKTEENEKEIILRWDRQLEQFYSSWIIERSDDGGNTFTPLNENPYIDSEQAELGVGLQWISYVDSLDKNYRPYSYRIRGINTFAERSHPSPAVIAMGRDRTPPPLPENIQTRELAPGQMLIQWEMPVESADLQGFLLSRAEDINGSETALTTEILPQETRSFIDTGYDPLKNNWYLVYAVDTAFNASVGLPVYGTIIDSIAPVIPAGFTGSIDSNGCVDLHWDLGPERDLYGYMLYYANAADHIFSNVTNLAIQDTFFRDTIPLNVLTEEIYYKLVALDHARNQSGFTDILELKKPDIVPPVAPVFHHYDIDENGIHLKWYNSDSHDVTDQVLYRKEMDGPAWEVLFKTGVPQEESGKYTDSSVLPDVYYTYRLQAFDDDGLSSEFSDSLTLKGIDFSVIPPVETLTAVFDSLSNSILLDWVYPTTHNGRFHVFKSENSGPFHVVASLDTETRQYKDEQITKNGVFEYTLMVTLGEKKQSDFSPAVRINVSENSTIKQ